jgi:hypothetical protein
MKITSDVDRVRFTCDNGYVLSVAYGSATYSTNYYVERGVYYKNSLKPAESVEMAILDKEGNFVELVEGYHVFAYVPAEKIPQILTLVQAGDLEKLKISLEDYAG